MAIRSKFPNLQEHPTDPMGRFVMLHKSGFKKYFKESKEVGKFGGSLDERGIAQHALITDTEDPHIIMLEKWIMGSYDGRAGVQSGYFGTQSD